jgi:hypothetical protein
MMKSKRPIGALKLGVVLGVTLMLLAACGDGGNRKASIPSSDKKPSTGAPGLAKADDQRPDKVQARQVPPGAARALAAMQKRIEKAAEKNKDKTFTSYLDESTGQIVLTTDASDETVAEVKNEPDPDNKKEIDKARVEHKTTKDVWHRRDDIPAFWGGAGITASGGTCSAGYAARNSAGTVFSVTAGHCWANGTVVSTESGANTYGTVSNRRLPSVTGGAIDVELVGGSSYAGYVYTGGLTSTTSIKVVAAGAAYSGYTNYCHSGRTTGQACGHTAQSVNGQVCTQTGCKSPVIVFTGGTMIQPGDSGGTFYAMDSSGAWIRGNTIASDGTTGYAEPWTTIAAELGLSIVTG